MFSNRLIPYFEGSCCIAPDHKGHSSHEFSQKKCASPFSNRLIFSICLIAGSYNLASHHESHPSHGYSQKKCVGPFSNRLMFSICLIP